MTDVSNQRIELDGAVLARQVTTLRDAASTLRSAASTTRTSIPADAFGVLCGGLLAPAVATLADRSRELLESAHTLAERLGEATDAAAKAFDALEAEAVSAFTEDGR